MIASSGAAGEADEDRGGRVQALSRALSLMSILARERDGASLTDAARAAGLAVSTTHRLLTTLQQDRFVSFDKESLRWSIGVQAFTVGTAFLQTRDIARTARPYLRRLMEETGETANLAVEDEGMAVYLAQVECRQTMRAIGRPGSRVFLHSSSLGKALLSVLPEAEAMALVARHGLGVMTRRTIADPEKLRRHLGEVARRGYAVDDEEYAPGLRCVAAVVCDEASRPLGAISISGPTIRVARERVPALGAVVRKLADDLTRELGGRPPPGRS